MTKNISRVAIVGGTHGNELTGVNLLEKWRHQAQSVSRPSFTTELLLANPQAVDQRRRYIDKDLNRSFTQVILEDLETSNYEIERARAINAKLGPKGNAKVDFIIDLHTSTANMGTNIVITRLDDFHQQLARYLLERDPSIKVTSEDQLMDDHHFLCSIAKHHAIVEIGPVAQGLGHHKTMQIMEDAVHLILDYIEAYNTQQLTDITKPANIYQYVSTEELPCDEHGNIQGVVHEALQDRDFQLLKKGDPIFQLFNGEQITYQGDAERYASFINEAAYYDKHLAFSLLRKITI